MTPSVEGFSKAVTNAKILVQELYNLADDPHEVTNLANHPKQQHVLEKMRKVWKEEIISARGSGPAKVLRYTIDSRRERAFATD